MEHIFNELEDLYQSLVRRMNKSEMEDFELVTFVESCFMNTVYVLDNSLAFKHSMQFVLLFIYLFIYFNLNYSRISLLIFPWPQVLVSRTTSWPYWFLGCMRCVLCSPVLSKP